MADNVLKPGKPRIGWYGDGLPEEITPNTATMLQDDGEQLVLTVPWLQQVPPSQIERWFDGGFASWGDDPDGTRYSYELPDELTFVDPQGSVVLIGCQSLGYTSTLPGVAEGRVYVQAAVLGGQRLGYSAVHSMRTEIPGLGDWFGLSSVTTDVKPDSEGRPETYSVSAGALDSVRLGRRLNLRVRPHWEASRKAGSHVIHDRVYLETSTKTPHGWNEHLQVHGTVRDLIDIATWQPTGYRSIFVSRLDDPVRDMSSGEAMDTRWCEVHTHAVRQQESPIKTLTSLYLFRHVNSTGHARWVRLREHFRRGVQPLLSLLDIPDAHVETQLIQSSIGLEAIGYQMALDDGVSERVARNEHLESRFERIRASLPFSLVADDWPTRAAGGYNGVKHANRPMPDILTMQNLLRENVLVFRLWAAHRIGVPATVLKQTIWREPDMQMLLRQGITHEPV